MAETVIFGVRLEGVAYADRPAAYAVVAGESGTVAAVKGTSGKFFLPGGSCLPGEAAEETVSPLCAPCLSVPCLDIYGCYW